MLVLTRRKSEDVVLPELGITIKVVCIQNGQIRIGIEAPRHITVLRGELVERQQEWSVECESSLVSC